MAEFCWDCLADDISPDRPQDNDFAGLCAPGDTVLVLCEGHGQITVDHRGRMVTPDVPRTDPAMSPTALPGSRAGED